MKRFLAFVSGILLLTSIGITPVLANATACGGVNFHFAGHSNSSPNTSRSGVSAVINPDDNDFDICTGSTTKGGVSAFVYIQQRTPNDSTKVMRFGIIECNIDYLDAYPCDGENHPHLFYQWGGCVPWTPINHDLGEIGLGPHTYAIWLGTDNYWHFVWDGVQMTQVSNTLIDCWTTELLQVGWSFKEADINDSVGSSNHLSWFDNALYGRYNLGWFDPAFPGGTCARHDLDMTCNLYDHDSLYGYSTN